MRVQIELSVILRNTKIIIFQYGTIYFGQNRRSLPANVVRTSTQKLNIFLRKNVKKMPATTVAKIEIPKKYGTATIMLLKKP